MVSVQQWCRDRSFMCGDHHFRCGDSCTDHKYTCTLSHLCGSVGITKLCAVIALFGAAIDVLPH